MRPEAYVATRAAQIMKGEGQAVAAMAVLSTRSGQIARSLASGCGWPIAYCPV